MRHLFVVAALVFLTALCSGCEHTPAATTSPTPVPFTPSPAPSPAASPVAYPVVNWVADASVVSARYGNGGPCGWGTRVGETRSGVYWHIEIRGDVIELDEDLPNWPTDDLPYKGTLRGTQFTASYEQGGDYLRSACQFRGATIAGEFNRDFSTFQAVETLGWGTPETGTSVERHWNGRIVGQTQ